MLFLSKMDEGDGGNQELGGESDDDEVEDDSVRSIRTDIVEKKIWYQVKYFFKFFLFFKINYLSHIDRLLM